MSYPKKVFLREVGSRDGLQNECQYLNTDEKEELIRRLVNSGFKDFELTSFVSPKAIPALADAKELIARLGDLEHIHFSALVPNVKGVMRALETDINSIVLFLSSSESHNQKNVNRSIAESLKGFEEIVKLVEHSDIKVRAAISTAFGCPFEGEVNADKVVDIATRLIDLGVESFSLGDTTGMATPPLVTQRIDELCKHVDVSKITLHFHNTRGIGLVNVMTGLSLGVTHYESSIGGLGGCPFAAGASGNIASEDLVYLLDEMNIDSGIDLNSLIETTKYLSQKMNKDLPAQVSKAGPRLALRSVSDVATATG